MISAAFAISSTDDASAASDLRGQLPGDSACAQVPPHVACAQLKRTLDSQYYHRDLAYAFGVAAGALVVTDVLLVIFWPAPSSGRALASHVIAAPAGSGGAIVGWAAQF